MHERDVEALREAAAEFVSREAGPQSLITVTRASLSDDRKRGVVFITVYPTEAESAALEFCNRNRQELAEYFEERIRGMRAPRIEFALDLGEKNRQRLDELS